MVVRFLLGYSIMTKQSWRCKLTLVGSVFEACVQPAFIIMTAMWYTRQEQTILTSLWYCSK